MQQTGIPSSGHLFSRQLTVTHRGRGKGGTCDVANVYFSHAIRRTDILVWFGISEKRKSCSNQLANVHQENILENGTHLCVYTTTDEK